jgi:hypothetical protein
MHFEPSRELISEWEAAGELKKSAPAQSQQLKGKPAAPKKK